MIGRIGPVEGASACRRPSRHRPPDRPHPDPRRPAASRSRAADPTLLETLGGTLAAGRFIDDAIDGYPAVVLGASPRNGSASRSLDEPVARLDRRPLVDRRRHPRAAAARAGDRPVGARRPGGSRAPVGADGSPTTIYVRAAGRAARRRPLPSCRRRPTRRTRRRSRSAGRPTPSRRGPRPPRRSRRCSSASARSRCSSAGSASPTSCSWRCWNGATRSACAGRSARRAATSSASSWPRPCCWRVSAGSPGRPRIGGRGGLRHQPGLARRAAGRRLRGGGPGGRAGRGAGRVLPGPSGREPGPDGRVAHVSKSSGLQATR